MGFLTSLFTGGGAMKSIENIAKEFIDTPQEKAAARTLFLKTLDPNGLMRRQISQAVTKLYALYLLVTMGLVLCQSFNIGDIEGIKLAITSLTDLFLPITGMFSAIVGASFGTNAFNIKKGI